MFNQKVEKMTPQQQMLSDPSAMTNMMYNNLSNIVPQMATMAWVNFFFSGFVVARVPFPLTQRFRGMLQRGVDLAELDVTYVSSLSWYFLNLFGINGLLGLALGETTSAMQDPSMAMAQQQAAMMGMDTKGAFVGEKEALEGQHTQWALPGIETNAIATLRRLLDTRTL